MNSVKSKMFFYPSWMKYAGMALIVFAIGIFVSRIVQFGITDLVGFSTPLAFGLMMIFFSKERVMDERNIYFKFKSIAISVPITAVLVSAYNYTKNFKGYSIGTDSWYSISAFESLSIMLLIAIAHYYYMKYIN